MTDDVAGGQEHRETNRQGGKQSQHDLFDVLLHCAEILVFFVLYGSDGFYGYFCSTASVYFRVRFLFCTDLTDTTDILSNCIRVIRAIVGRFVLYG